MTRKSKRSQASQQNGSKADPPPPRKLTSQQISELGQEGYTLIEYARSKRTELDKNSRSQLVNEILTMGGTIFNNEEVGPGDGTRLQLIREWPNLPGKAASIISRRIEATFPHLIPGDAQFLLSLAHGHDQRPHLDMISGHDQLENPDVAAVYSHSRGQGTIISDHHF